MIFYDAINKLKYKRGLEMKRFFLLLISFSLIFPALSIAKSPVLTISSGGHMDKIKDIMFTKNGRYLVSASDDKSIRIWDTASGELVRSVFGQVGVGNDGKIYAAALIFVGCRGMVFTE